MIIIGITGSMGMGKTTFSNFFLKKNIPVFDADQEVNNIYKEDILYYKLKKIRSLLVLSPAVPPYVS